MMCHVGTDDSRTLTCSQTLSREVNCLVQTVQTIHVEFLETLENGGAPIERDDMGNPTDALPIGAPFPDFSLREAPISGSDDPASPA